MFMQSVLNYKVPVPGRCDHLCIPLEDSETANLLGALEGALKFMGQAVDSGGCVLVHCHNGVSRSVAVVAAFMCHRMHLNFEAALEALRMNVPAAQPNAGFVQQVKLFVEMGCQIDHNNAAYKRFKLLQLGIERDEHGCVDSGSTALPNPTKESKDV
jgi:protein-tyrosine phosphatase